MKLQRLTVLALLGLVLMTSGAFANSPLATKEFYAIKLYHLKDKDQETRLDAYLQKAYIPALHKAGIARVGVFKPVGMDTVSDKRVYVFMPVKNMEEIMRIDEKLAKDEAYNSAGADYLNTAYNAPAYQRMEIILLEAFDMMPKMALPKLNGPKSERIYELRSYESASEKLHKNKVEMFNKGGEVTLFNRLGFNAVFYARVIAGSHMPNLMYMTTFENKAVRDEHWKAFSADAEWKALSARPEYKNNVSRNDTQFLFPADYSDF